MSNIPTQGPIAPLDNIHHPQVVYNSISQKSDRPETPAKDENKGKTQTVFIHKLYDMLEDSSLSHLIWWSPSNDSFCLYPGEEFSAVLSQYFKHTNIASFIRQLNMYGFHKVNDSFHSTDDPSNSASNSASNPSPNPSNPSSHLPLTKWEFRHAASHFRKGDLESLKLIKRKASKVMNSHKEIVNLKSLPPVPSHDQRDVDSDSDIDHLHLHRALLLLLPLHHQNHQQSQQQQQQQQYHRSLYNQAWKQQAQSDSIVAPAKPPSPASPTDQPHFLAPFPSSTHPAPSSAPPHDPTSQPHLRPLYSPSYINLPHHHHHHHHHRQHNLPHHQPHPSVHQPPPLLHHHYLYPGFSPHQISVPAPVSPSTPPFPNDVPPVPTPPTSFVSQSGLRQPSNNGIVPVDHSFNLKLIEMNNAIVSLSSTCAALEAKYNHLNEKYSRCHHDLLSLVDVLESNSQQHKPHAPPLSVKKDDLVDRSRTSSPVHRAPTPSLDPTASPRPSPFPDLSAFKKHLLNADSPTPAPTSNSPHPGAINPNFSLYGSDFRQYKISHRVADKDTSANPSYRHFSVLVDPLQPLVPRSHAGDGKASPVPLKESKDVKPDAKDSKEKPVHPQVAHVQHYQPKVNHQAASQLYQPYIRGDPAHQQRTVSLPILDRVLPQSFALQGFHPQRHSTTTILMASPPAHKKEELASSMAGADSDQPALSVTSNPVPPSSASAPPVSGDASGATRKLLPSVQELDNLIKRSTSGRLHELLTDDEDPPQKKSRTDSI